MTEPAPAAPASAVTFAATYYGDLFDTASGGFAPGAAYEGRLGLLLDVDLDKALGWSDTQLHASVHQIHGEAPTPAHVGALALLSGIEAEPNTRLFNLWIQKAVAPQTTLRIGQFTAGQEFAVSSTAGLFVNSTFGWPNILAQDLPSGGPAYPVGALGLRLSHTTADKAVLLLGVFNGDPAGPGDGDPQRRDRHGFNSFRWSGGPFVVAEVQLPATPRATVRLGTWWLGRETPAQPLGPSIPTTFAAPSAYGDWGGYAIVDAVLIKRETLGISGFVRLSAAPGGRNLVSAYADGGVTVSGFSASRPNDQIGLAASVSRIGDGARSLDAAAVAAGDLPFGRDWETVIELTYQAQLTSHWWLQPDVQWIGHPGGRVPLPSNAARAIPDAVVLGVRNTLKF